MVILRLLDQQSHKLTELKRIRFNKLCFKISNYRARELAKQTITNLCQSMSDLEKQIYQVD